MENTKLRHKILAGKDFINILEFSENTDDNEYLDQALEFLKNTNSEILIKYDGYRIREDWGIDKPGDNYKVILKNQKGKYEFIFTNSIAHSSIIAIQNKCTTSANYKKWEDRSNHNFKVPNAYDILSCLDCMELNSVDDYIQDFGIDIKSAQDFRNAEKTFNAIQHEEISLLRMYTTEEIDQLREIN